MELKKTLCLSAIASAACALALTAGGFGVTSAEAAPAMKAPPPQEKSMEKPTLSNMKEQAKEHAKEKVKQDAKEKVAEKLGIEQKQPMKPGMPIKK